MTAIFKSFRQAFHSILRLRLFLLALLPPFVAFLGLLFLFVVFWQPWLTGLTAMLESVSFLHWLQEITQWPGFLAWAAIIFLILAFIPLAYLAAVLFTSLLVMPVVLKVVPEADFKGLQKKRGGSVLGSLWNALVASVIYIIAFMVTLPLWLLPGMQIAIPLALTAWLNKRVFLYDVLQDFASLDERKLIEKQERGSLYGMGFLLGLLSYIPLAFFLVPVLSALCYAYYGLNALEEHRRKS